MSSTSKSGIQTSADGSSYIPSSRRADGSTRKEIRVRPGYRPPEDVETYKNRSAEAWKTRGSGGVPGVETTESSNASTEVKSKNAKRREAAKKKAQEEVEIAPSVTGGDDLSTGLDKVDITEQTTPNDNSAKSIQTVSGSDPVATAEEVEQQKKIRNQLKKLRAVRELKEKKNAGEKLSHDQLMKIGKEEELLRDLKKLNYNGPEITQDSAAFGVIQEKNG